MDTNEPSVEQPGSCCDSSSGGADCCSPGSGGAGAGQKRWKTGVFVVVIVLAGAVAAHSLLTKNGQTSGVPPCRGGLGTPCGACPIEQGQSCPKTAVCPSVQNCCPKQDGCPLSDQQDQSSSCCPQATPAGCSHEQDGCPLSDQQDQPPSCCPQTAPPGCCPGTGS